MKYEQEGHARDLGRALSRNFSGSAPETQVSLEGGGVNWRCAARRGDRSCSVTCFDNQGPEYLVFFQLAIERAAIGRTVSRADVVSAVGNWLDGHAMAHMHETFEFIDKFKRALMAVEAGVIELRPELGRMVSSEIRHINCDIFELWFKSQDRSCCIDYHGRNPLPDAVFHWELREQLRIRTGDVDRLAAMLKRWLCDQAMPSRMAEEFPEAEFHQVAQYYEKGRPLEGEFITSWGYTERSFDDAPSPHAKQVLGLIAKIRQAGYDRAFRAGQSVGSLVVSRSLRHGLREDQPRIVFHFESDGMTVYNNINSNERESFPKIDLFPPIVALFERLMTREID